MAAICIPQTRSCEECLRRVRRRVLAASFTFGRDGAVVDEAERGPGRTSEWGGSRPANPPGVVAGLGFRSREISRTRTTATRHHQAGRPGICDSYSVSDVQDLAQTAFRRRVLHEDVLAVQSTCRWEQPPNLAAGAFKIPVPQPVIFMEVLGPERSERYMIFLLSPVFFRSSKEETRCERRAEPKAKDWRL